MRKSLIGEYLHGTSVIDGRRYAVMNLEGVILRVRKVTPFGEPTIWDANEPMTEQMIQIIANARYETVDDPA